MPNHIINKVKVNKNLKQIKEKVKSEISEFDFNKIIPMPEELIDTRSPSKPIENMEEYEKELAQYNKIKNDPNKYPTKPITVQQSKEYIAKYGSDNWYDWSCANWGTKWNAYDINISEDDITFQTAWSTPTYIFVALSRQFSDILFTIEYADEDIGSNCGTYQIADGIIVFDEDGDEEFACALWDMDYQDYLNDRE